MGCVQQAMVGGQGPCEPAGFWVRWVLGSCSQAELLKGVGAVQRFPWLGAAVEGRPLAVHGEKGAPSSN